MVRVLDEAGRLVSETSTVSGSGTSSTVTYTYNTDGQRETVSLDGSQVASYTYVDGFLDTIDSGEAQPFDFDYDELGRRTTLAYPNGVVTSYSYHPTLGWLTGIQAVKDAATILDVSYDHDLIGNRTEKSVDGLTEGTSTTRHRNWSRCSVRALRLGVGSTSTTASATASRSESTACRRRGPTTTRTGCWHAQPEEAYGLPARPARRRR